jgi:small subunit ribosomal protein S6
MFLIDSAKASADWDGVLATIRNILEKADAEIDSITKWAERKLAYKINGKSRGTYILCYFRADGERIREIEREIKLSEQIMRVLILSAESISREDIEKKTPAMLADTEGREQRTEGREQRAEDREQKAENI